MGLERKWRENNSLISRRQKIREIPTESVLAPKYAILARFSPRRSVLHGVTQHVASPPAARSYWPGNVSFGIWQKIV
jgi:hypothetical protein